MIKTIRTDKGYAEALARLDELMGAEVDTPEGAELAALATLIERWEKGVLYD